MLGDSLKVSPVMDKMNDGSQYQAYFPQGVWVNLYNSSEIITAPA